MLVRLELNHSVVISRISHSSLKRPPGDNPAATVVGQGQNPFVSSPALGERQEIGRTCRTLSSPIYPFFRALAKLAQPRPPQASSSHPGLELFAGRQSLRRDIE